jgi:hypothetical protein
MVQNGDRLLYRAKNQIMTELNFYAFLDLLIPD